MHYILTCQLIYKRALRRAGAENAGGAGAGRGAPVNLNMND